MIRYLQFLLDARMLCYRHRWTTLGNLLEREYRHLAEIYLQHLVRKLERKWK